MKRVVPNMTYTWISTNKELPPLNEKETPMILDVPQWSEPVLAVMWYGLDSCDPQIDSKVFNAKYNVRRKFWMDTETSEIIDCRFVIFWMPFPKSPLPSINYGKLTDTLINLGWK